MLPPFVAVVFATLCVLLIAHLEHKAARRKRRQQVLDRLLSEQKG
jgi:hypothetical protein